MFGKDRTPPQTQAAQNPPSQPNPASAPAALALTPKIETVIGPNCRINGVLSSDVGVRVEGIVEGTIQITGNLIVAETGRVIAEVQAYNVLVAGQLKGNITANKVEITETGKVWGDLNVNSLLLHEGAYLRGTTNMAGDVEPPAYEPPRIASPRPIAALESADADSSEDEE